MNIERIKEIQSETAYPDSVSIQQALLQVWQECVMDKAQVFEILWPIIKNEREMRLDGSECGGCEVAESIDNLKYECMNAIGIIN